MSRTIPNPNKHFDGPTRVRVRNSDQRESEYKKTLRKQTKGKLLKQLKEFRVKVNFTRIKTEILVLLQVANKSENTGQNNQLIIKLDWQLIGHDLN